MSDEIKEVETMENDYLKVIEDLKANSVKKEEYDKMLEENRKLLNSIVNGQQIQVAEEEPEIESSDFYRNQIDHAQTNLDYITAVCNYRDAVLKESGEDIFTLHKPGERVDEFELQAARDTADVFKQCIEDSEGDPKTFNALLQRRFVDTSGNSYRR